MLTRTAHIRYTAWLTGKYLNLIGEILLRVISNGLENYVLACFTTFKFPVINVRTKYENNVKLFL